MNKSKAGPEPRWPNIPAMVEDAAERWPDVPAVIGEPTLTFGQLLSAVRKFSASLVSAGIAQGDRVAIWAPNSSEWIIAALGTFGAGAVLVPVNTRYRGREAATILRSSGARALVTAGNFLSTDYVAMLRQSGIDLPHLTTIVTVDDDNPAAAKGWAKFLASSDTSAADEVARRRARLRADDMSTLLFTSGTTGDPKGVVGLHGRDIACAVDWIGMTGLHAGDRYIMINPYFHLFGLQAGILTSIAAGATMIPQQVFDVERALDIVQREQVTVFPGAPTIFSSILDHPRFADYDLSTLRVAVTGAADIPVELIRRLNDELPNFRIVSAYGMTETGTACTTLLDDELEHIASTVGVPRPGFEIRVVDGKGKDVPAGEAGEILLRSPTVMPRYYDDPQATKATISDDGWLRTGDAGKFDDTGRLRIVGRIKDMFIVGGFNAYPAEIENVLLRHPDIQDAAVIGVPDHRLGEVGMAFVVLHPAAALSEAEVIAWSRAQMANFKVPRVVRFVNDLPRTATGKIQKHVLKSTATQSVS